MLTYDIGDYSGHGEGQRCFHGIPVPHVPAVLVIVPKVLPPQMQGYRSLPPQAVGYMLLIIFLVIREGIHRPGDPLSYRHIHRE